MIGPSSANPLLAGLQEDQVAQPCTLVIFGGAGDLSKRKLLPAMYNQALEGSLPGVVAPGGATVRGGAQIASVEMVPGPDHVADEKRWKAVPVRNTTKCTVARRIEGDRPSVSLVVVVAPLRGTIDQEAAERLVALEVGGLVDHSTEAVASGAVDRRQRARRSARHWPGPPRAGR